jgi:hypothetical protein
MPMDKCTASAAGGTNQRLKSALATVFSLDKKLAIQSSSFIFIFFKNGNM